MEFKATFFAILLLFHLTKPCCYSTGRLHVKSLDLEVYVIDYRGPETHTNIPSPNWARNMPKIPQQTNVVHNKPKYFKGKKIHG